MLTAARMILHSHQVATKRSCLASTGILTLTPGSTNTVPGKVRFSLDLRASEDARLMEMEEQLKIEFEKIAKNEPFDNMILNVTPGKGCLVEWALDAPSEAIKFDEDCIRCVQRSAKDLLGSRNEAESQSLTSGAGHDSVRIFFLTRTLTADLRT